MKRLLVLFFVFFSLGLTLNVNANSNDKIIKITERASSSKSFTQQSGHMKAQQKACEKAKNKAEKNVKRKAIKYGKIISIKKYPVRTSKPYSANKVARCTGVAIATVIKSPINQIEQEQEKNKIVKTEPVKKKKVVKKEQPKKKKVVKKEITKVGNSKRIKKIIKIDNKEPIKENISLWEKNVLAALEREKNDPYCEIVDKITLKKLFKKKKGEKKIVLNFCIKKSDLLKLGEYKKFNPPTFILDDLKGCKSSACVDKKAGKKVYELFVRRGSQYHARHPGDMIKGMVWFEILYQAKLKKAQKALKMYQENNYKDFMALKKKDHEKQIYSLIKLNKGRLKMRKALGFSLYNDLYEVIEGQWLLAEFLNKDKLKVSKVKLTPEMFKRKILIEKYKTVLAKYQKKLEEEKQKKIK